jgi:hypothetical protein
VLLFILSHALLSIFSHAHAHAHCGYTCNHNCRYGLRRRQTRKKDFISYIEYEMNCEKLRLRRKEERRIQKRASAPSEFGGRKRILFIFQRAVQKWKGDYRLWSDYFDFADAIGAHKVLGRAFAEALRFMPLKAELWVRAAAWEYGANDNAKSARVLLQRGLRLAPESKSLWKEYLRLELCVAARMHALLVRLPFSSDTTRAHRITRARAHAHTHARNHARARARTCMRARL